MKTDCELLELAAKAAGMAYIPEMSKPHPVSGAWWGLWLKYDREPHEFDRRHWNPLADDGDALRLAVQLGILERNDALAAAIHEEQKYHDRPAAVRRAIVRIAAESVATKEAK